MPPSDFWTPDRFDLLVELWPQQAIPACEIAELLGCTKNAIIGKANRSELPPRKEPEPVPERSPHPLADIGARDCRFPIGHPRDSDFNFCRARVGILGRAYCDEHHSLAYRRRIVLADEA